MCFIFVCWRKCPVRILRLEDQSFILTLVEEMSQLSSTAPAAISSVLAVGIVESLRGHRVSLYNSYQWRGKRDAKPIRLK